MLSSRPHILYTNVKPADLHAILSDGEGVYVHQIDDFAIPGFLRKAECDVAALGSKFLRRRSSFLPSQRLARNLQRWSELEMSSLQLLQ